MMPSRVFKPNPLSAWTAFIALVITLVVYAVNVANSNGALQQKVAMLEANQQRQESALNRQDVKLSAHGESLARIEGKLDDVRQLLTNRK